MQNSGKFILELSLSWVSILELHHQLKHDYDKDLVEGSITGKMKWRKIFYSCSYPKNMFNVFV